MMSIQIDHRSVDKMHEIFSAHAGGIQPVQTARLASFRCQVPNCPQDAYINRRDLINHISSKHSLIPTSAPVLMVPPVVKVRMSTTTNTFPCPNLNCDKHFTRRSYRNRHIAARHPALKNELHSPTKTKMARTYRHACDKCKSLHKTLDSANGCCQTLQGKRALKRKSARSAIEETVPIPAPSTASVAVPSTATISTPFLPVCSLCTPSVLHIHHQYPVFLPNHQITLLNHPVILHNQLVTQR